MHGRLLQAYFGRHYSSPVQSSPVQSSPANKDTLFHKIFLTHNSFLKKNVNTDFLHAAMKPVWIGLVYTKWLVIATIGAYRHSCEVCLLQVPSNHTSHHFISIVKLVQRYKPSRSIATTSFSTVVPVHHLLCRIQPQC